MPKTREWLILNAVKAWLHNYDDGTQDELTPQYDKLHKELYNAYITKDTPVQKRGRPAKRQRKKTTTSTEASQKASQTTD